MRFRSLEEWLNWQVVLHHREIELGLERVSAVWRRLWDKPLPFDVLTVAGTNGKGSSVAFLEAMLLSAGFRVGCFTSPHLARYNERIRVNGEEAGDELICRAFEAVDQARNGTPLTFFEFGALAALCIFTRSDLDAAVLEVGLGGRLDAVNIIDPDVALITTIGMDHTAWLGSTLEDIAREKSGIMRQGRPVVCATPAPPLSLQEHAANLGARLLLAGRDFGFEMRSGSWAWQGLGRRLQGLPMPAMRGDYQLRNASGALMVLTLIQDRLPVNEQALHRGLQTAKAAARFEMVAGPPVTILDVAHNPHAAAALAGNLAQTPCDGRTLAVFAMVADKDAGGVVAALSPQVDEWHLADLGIPRGVPPSALAETLLAASVGRERIFLHSDPGSAYRGARSAAGERDRLLVFGSFYLVGDVIDLVRSGKLLQ